METNIMPFGYGDHLVRVVQGEDGGHWWVARDVCKALELSDANMAVKNLDDDEKGASKVCTPGGEQNVITISESGLYTLIIRSNKPEAKVFRRWITHEVLPAIRKTGAYAIPGSEASGMIGDGAVKKAGNMYFPMAKLVKSADKFLEGKAALRALNYFTGMPVDDLLDELENKKLKTKVGSLGWARDAIEDFISEECEFSEEYSVQASPIYRAFCNWCRNKGVLKVVSQRRFGAVLSANFEKVKSGTISYLGLRMKEKVS